MQKMPDSSFAQEPLLADFCLSRLAEIHNPLRTFWIAKISPK